LRRLLNDRHQLFALLTAEHLRIFDVRMSKPARQYHGRRHDWTGKGSAANLIDSGSRFKAARSSVGFE
jgi:hypothetical protein